MGLSIVILFLGLLPLQGQAATISNEAFAHIPDVKTQDHLLYFLNNFNKLSDNQKALAAEALTVKILNLPAQTYEQTLGSLKTNFSKQPISVEYLARFLHTTWLAKYGNEHLARLQQSDFMFGSPASAMGVAGLTLTAFASWKEPGKWAKYTRLVRDIFVPVGMTAGTAAGVLQLRSHFSKMNSPVPPMAFFDFPIGAEQSDELVAQAYQDLLLNIGSVGTATGLSRFLMTSKNFLALATEGSSIGGRVIKPLLLVALLSYGAGELTGFAINETRFAGLVNDFTQQRLKMENAFLSQPNASYAQVNSFLQASRRMSFFMFYPVMKMQTEANESVYAYNQEYATRLDERQKMLNLSIKVLSQRISGAPLTGDPLELLTDEEIYSVQPMLLTIMIQQLMDEAQVNVMRNGPRDLTEYEQQMREYAATQVESLKTYLPQALAKAEHDVAENEERIFQNLKHNLKQHLYGQQASTCQYEFEKYEFINLRKNKVDLQSDRWESFLRLSADQRAYGGDRNGSRLDLWLKSLGQHMNASNVPRQALPPGIDLLEELEGLNSRWQREWSRGDLCRHSPLFLTQTYEYLKRIPHGSAKEATQQSLELLVAQKILIESILRN